MLNGEDFTTSTLDNPPPNIPNKLLQISAIFELREILDKNNFIIKWIHFV